jgi:hypothetical protein
MLGSGKPCLHRHIVLPRLHFVQEERGLVLNAIRDALAAVNIVSPIELDGVTPNDIIAAMRAHSNSPRAAGADMDPATEALVKRLIRRCQTTDTQPGEHLAFSFHLTLYHVQVPAPL